MRTLFLRLLATFGIAASAGAAGATKSDIMAPPAVLRLAEAFVLSLPQQENAARENDLRSIFVRAFFWGFVDPKSSINGGTPADHAGFQAGQNYRLSNPGKLKDTMEGFGYTSTNAEGTWTVWFEHSGFRSRDHAGKDWWLRTLPDPESSLPIGCDVPEGGGSVRILGFLSPTGRYGHLGGYARQFFATNISLIKVGQQGAAANESPPGSSGTNRTSAAAGSHR